MKDPKITKYFSQKNHPLAMVVAIALIAVGFCILLFMYWLTLSMPLMLVGGLILLLLSLQTKDSEIDACCDSAEAAFREAYEARFICNDPRKRQGNKQTVEPVYITTYLADGYGILTRRGNDGKLRTSSCQCVGLLVDGAGVQLGQQTVSLIGGEEHTPIFSAYAFSELSEVTLSAPIAPHTVRMDVRDAEGETVFCAQISDGADNELLVQTINARIRKARAIGAEK